jgi:hypothetical protein
VVIYTHSAGHLGFQILADEEKFALPEIRETRSIEVRVFLSPENVL